MKLMKFYLIDHPEKRYEFTLVDSWVLNSFHTIPKVHGCFDISADDIKDKINIIRETTKEDFSAPITKIYYTLGSVDNIRRTKDNMWNKMKAKEIQYPRKIIKISKKDIGDNRSERIRTTKIEILFVEVIRKGEQKYE